MRKHEILRLHILVGSYSVGAFFAFFVKMYAKMVPQMVKSRAWRILIFDEF